MSPESLEPVAKDEVIDVIEALAEVGNGVGKAMADGEFTWTDAIYLGPIGLKLPAALSGISQVPEQLANATPEQMELWKARFVEKFDISDDKAEAMVEDYVRIAADLSATIKKHHFTEEAV